MPNWFKKSQHVDPEAVQQGTPMPGPTHSDLSEQLSIKLDECAVLAQQLGHAGGKDTSAWIKQLKEMAANARFISGL
jgi:hypothetical protein